jgi:hypothetical protein
MRHIEQKCRFAPMSLSRHKPTCPVVLWWKITLSLADRRHRLRLRWSLGRCWARGAECRRARMCARNKLYGVCDSVLDVITSDLFVFVAGDGDRRGSASDAPQTSLHRSRPCSRPCYDRIIRTHHERAASNQRLICTALWLSPDLCPPPASRYVRRRYFGPLATCVLQLCLRGVHCQ